MGVFVLFVIDLIDVKATVFGTVPATGLAFPSL